MGNPKISVIIPMYNTEKYLMKCIDCVLSQTFPDFEVLLIDDGSSDNSGKICDEYAEKDKRIRVFHKENGGVSSARNLGLEKANGEYITFLDADDELVKDCFAVINNKMLLNFDIIRFDIAYISANNSILYEKTMHSLELQAQRDLIYERRTIISVWGGVYKKFLFDNNNIIFNKGVKLGEDWIVLYKLFCNASTYYYIEEPLYLYRNNDSSVTNTCGMDELQDLLFAMNEIKNTAFDNAINHSCKSNSLLVTNIRLVLMIYDIGCFRQKKSNYFKKKDFPKQSFFKDCFYSSFIFTRWKMIVIVVLFYSLCIIKRGKIC